MNDELVPILSQLSDFVAYYFVDAGNRTMISTSMFQDRASADGSNSRAADSVWSRLASIVLNPPQITAGEVAASKTQ